MVTAGMNSTTMNSTTMTRQSDAYEESTSCPIDPLSYESYLENPEIADVDRSGSIDVKEAIALAFGLTINNLGTGVAAGISGLNIAFTTILTFAFSILGVVSGYFLGDRFTTKMTGVSAGVLSGVIIIALGVYEYFIP